tara:strand:- start:372 stop:515 length:144 start_codon:yes stop_codon:yes gene_type:complete
MNKYSQGLYHGFLAGAIFISCVWICVASYATSQSFKRMLQTLEAEEK